MLSWVQQNERSLVGTILLGALSSISVSTAQQPAETILDGMRRANVSGQPAFTLQVQIEQAVDWKNDEQGEYSKTCRITHSSRGVAITCETDRQPTPVYRPPGQGSYGTHEYDANGNLVIWIPQMSVTIQTDNRNETYQEQKSYFLDPRGAVVITGLMRVLDRYQPTDATAWSLAEMRQVWWALGQGLAPDFQRSKGEASEFNGRQRLRVQGTRDHGSLLGEWNLLVDPLTSMVRSASFQLDGLESSPSLEIETRGLRRFGLFALPEEGFARFHLGGVGGRVVKRVRLQDFSILADESLLDQARLALDNASFGGELTIYDYRGNPSRPTVTQERP